MTNKKGGTRQSLAAAMDDISLSNPLNKRSPGTINAPGLLYNIKSILSNRLQLQHYTGVIGAVTGIDPHIHQEIAGKS